MQSKQPCGCNVHSIGAIPTTWANFKHNDMRTSNVITSALIIATLTSLVGVVQSQTWEHFGMFTFGVTISVFMLGLIATEK